VSHAAPAAPPSVPAAAPRTVALLAEFDSPGALLTAAELVRDAGFRRWDTHTPFPVHGIDQAMGIRRTRLPWIVFAAGLFGCTAGLVLQWFTNATSAADAPGLWTIFQGYNYVISEKPALSLPAFVPVIFELTILCAALAAVIGMLAMNDLPRHPHPLLALPRFRRVTSDRFYLVVDADDPQFDPVRTRAFLRQLPHAVAVEDVPEDRSSAALPRGLVIAITILVALALLPPLLVARARLSKTTEPRIHLIQDMDNQERFKTQQAGPFADRRASRPPIPGTIARGDLAGDAHLLTGRLGNDWAATFPASLAIDLPFVQRGRERYGVFCAPCHGYGGAGDGIVSQRALRLNTEGWVQPTSLLDQTVRDRPVGHIFNTITNGIRSMPPYGDQIPPADRWAIVAYIRALQRSQNARLEDIPPHVQADLR